MAQNTSKPPSPAGNEGFGNLQCLAACNSHLTETLEKDNGSLAVFWLARRCRLPLTTASAIAAANGFGANQ